MYSLAGGCADISRAEHVAIAGARSITKPIAEYDAGKSTLANAFTRRAEFSSVGSRHSFQRTPIRQRPFDRANSGWGYVVRDRQRTCAF